MWIKSAQAAMQGSSESSIHLASKEENLHVERFRGDEWAVTLKAVSGVCNVLFRQFASVRASGFMCPSGSAAYYELQVLRVGGLLQWGFCSEAFERTDTQTDTGVGDDASSWAVDGDRQLLWHNGMHPFGGRRWQEGDVIGLACDLRAGSHAPTSEQGCNNEEVGGCIWVSLNGDFSPPHGLVFHLEQGIRGLYAAFTSRSGAVGCNLGEAPFKHAPPGEGFKPMCSFVHGST